MDKPIFSIILLHYNQPRYVKKAIDSILLQTYENIEFIFADDFSSDMDLQNLKDYVETNKSKNIKNVIWQINNENLGTVKNLNNAIKKCNGKYILFFAADDKLYDKNVITNFVKCFNSVPNDVYMISAQCHMMDIRLRVTKNLFVSPNFANEFNSYSAKEQFKVFSKTCFLAMGATCMKAEMFKKFGLFNEKYKLVEDWSYFLHLTRNGGRAVYHDIDALYHRDGGNSHHIDNNLIPQSVLDYKLDIINIFENEILPYIKNFTTREKVKVIDWYESEKKGYLECGGVASKLSQFKLLKLMPIFTAKRFLWGILSISPHEMVCWFNRLVKLCIIWATLILFKMVLTAEPSKLTFLSKIFPPIFNLLNFYILPTIALILFLIFAMFFIVYSSYLVKGLLKKLFQ